MGIKKVPSPSTLQKFFKRLPTSIITKINNNLLSDSNINPEIIVLDGTRFFNDCSDKYYEKIRGKKRKKVTECHIAIDVDTKIILHSQALNGLRNDLKFAIPCIK